MVDKTFKTRIEKRIDNINNIFKGDKTTVEIVNSNLEYTINNYTVNLKYGIVPLYSLSSDKQKEILKIFPTMFYGEKEQTQRVKDLVETVTKIKKVNICKEDITDVFYNEDKEYSLLFNNTSIYSNLNFPTFVTNIASENKKGKYNGLLIGSNSQKTTLFGEDVRDGKGKGLSELTTYKISENNGEYIRTILSGTLQSGDGSRKIENVDSIHNIVVDLDATGVTLSLILDTIKKLQLPVPNYVNFSGNGMHLVYTLTLPVRVYGNTAKEMLNQAVSLFKLIIADKVTSNIDVKKVDHSTQSIVHATSIAGTLYKKSIIDLLEKDYPNFSKNIYSMAISNETHTLYMLLKNVYNKFLKEEQATTNILNVLKTYEEEHNVDSERLVTAVVEENKGDSKEFSGRLFSGETPLMGSKIKALKILNTNVKEYKGYIQVTESATKNKPLVVQHRHHGTLKGAVDLLLKGATIPKGERSFIAKTIGLSAMQLYSEKEAKNVINLMFSRFETLEDFGLLEQNEVLNYVKSNAKFFVFPIKDLQKTIAILSRSLDRDDLFTNNECEIIYKALYYYQNFNQLYFHKYNTTLKVVQLGGYSDIIDFFGDDGKFKSTVRLKELSQELLDRKQITEKEIELIPTSPNTLQKYKRNSEGLRKYINNNSEKDIKNFIIENAKMLEKAIEAKSFGSVKAIVKIVEKILKIKNIPKSLEKLCYKTLGKYHGENITKLTSTTKVENIEEILDCLKTIVSSVRGFSECYKDLTYSEIIETQHYKEVKDKHFKNIFNLLKIDLEEISKLSELMNKNIVTKEVILSKKTIETLKRVFYVAKRFLLYRCKDQKDKVIKGLLRDYIQTITFEFKGVLIYLNNINDIFAKIEQKEIIVEDAELQALFAENNIFFGKKAKEKRKAIKAVKFANKTAIAFHNNLNYKEIELFLKLPSLINKFTLNNEVEIVTDLGNNFNSYYSYDSAVKSKNNRIKTIGELIDNTKTLLSFGIENISSTTSSLFLNSRVKKNIATSVERILNNSTFGDYKNIQLSLIKAELEKTIAIYKSFIFKNHKDFCNNILLYSEELITTFRKENKEDYKKLQRDLALARTNIKRYLVMQEVLIVLNAYISKHQVKTFNLKVSEPIFKNSRVSKDIKIARYTALVNEAIRYI